MPGTKLTQKKGAWRKSYRKRKAKTTRKPKVDRVFTYIHKPQDRYIVDDGVGAVKILPEQSDGDKPFCMRIGDVSGSPTGFSGIYDFPMVCNFNMANLLNHEAYLALYDQYRFDWVELKLTTMSNIAAVNGLAVMPSLHWAIDYDDATMPANKDTVQGMATSKTFTFGNKSRMTYKIRFVPRVSQYVYTTVANSPPAYTGNLIPKPYQWLDCQNYVIAGQPVDNSLIQHFGLKLWFSDVVLNNSNNTGFRAQWRYQVSYRNPIKTG